MLGASAFFRPIPVSAAEAPRFAAYPFSLGVASGSPRADSVVLWTRLAPLPLREDGGIDPLPFEVRWEIAADESFRRIVKSGTAIADPSRAHAIHVEAGPLEPAREYFYRFDAGDARSPVGRTRTAPAPGHGDERLRMAFASCQQYEQGFYNAHAHLATEDIDLVAFLGDYIYESSWGRDHVRKHGAGEPRTLADYRVRHALYKSDGNLQKSHASAPWIVIWDDHEVENDYADDRSQTLDPHFLARRAAAYRAYFEHMPLRSSVLRANGEVRIYARHEFGALATIHALDDRQYRSHQACAPEGKGGGRLVGGDCTERLIESRTLLGRDQERWLDEGLGASRARWNLIAQQTRFMESARPDGKGGFIHWTDGWDGYPGARSRLLASIAARKPANPVLIGGDVHANFVADIRARAGDSSSPILAAEFCGTSISSQGNTVRVTDEIRANNPDIAFAESTMRGYVLLDIRTRRLEAKLRVVETVKQPGAGVSTLASFAVETGRPGLQK